MLGFFIANGKSSKEFNVYISDADSYGIAERDTNVVSVAGRSGDLVLDNGRYKNKNFSYPGVITEDFDVNFDALVNYLIIQPDYMRIEDSFHPGQFIMARYIGETDPKRITINSKQGTFELKFDRKPQRFLKEGEAAISVTAASSIYNAYDQTALPLIRAYGTGSFAIGDIAIQITTADSYTDIDCNLQEAYKDTLATNCNGNIVLTDGKFPKLAPGENAITLSGISRLEIIPRWWIL